MPPSNSRSDRTPEVLALAEHSGDEALMDYLGLGGMPKQAAFEALKGMVDKGVGAVKDTAAAIGGRYDDTKRGLMDEIIRGRAAAESAGVGAAYGGVLGAGARGIQALMNPKTEKWYETLWRHIAGGVDPASLRGRAQHIGGAAAEGFGQGAMIGAPLGAAVNGPMYARRGREAYEAASGGAAPTLRDLAQQAFKASRTGGQGEG